MACVDRMKETIPLRLAADIPDLVSLGCCNFLRRERDVIREKLCLKLISDDFFVYRKTFSNLEKFGKSNFENSLLGMGRAKLKIYHPGFG
jgi:hypothetical protein